MIEGRKMKHPEASHADMTEVTHALSDEFISSIKASDVCIPCAMVRSLAIIIKVVCAGETIDEDEVLNVIRHVVLNELEIETVSIH